jgi:hypothetical protein
MKIKRRRIADNNKVRPLLFKIFLRLLYQAYEPRRLPYCRCPITALSAVLSISSHPACRIFSPPNPVNSDSHPVFKGCYKAGAVLIHCRLNCL